MTRDESKQMIAKNPSGLLPQDKNDKGDLYPIYNNNSEDITINKNARNTYKNDNYSQDAEFFDSIGSINPIQNANEPLQIGDEFNDIDYNNLAYQQGLSSFADVSKAKQAPNKESLVNNVEQRASKSVGLEPDYRQYLKQAANDNNYTYLLQRGISKPTQARFNIGFDKNWRHPNHSDMPQTPRCIIPTSKYSYLAKDIRDNVPADEKKHIHQQVGPIHLFNQDALNNRDRDIIFITQSEIDALSIAEIGRDAIGLGSISNVQTLMNIISKNDIYTDKAFIIACNLDDYGRSVAQKFIHFFERNHIIYINWESHVIKEHTFKNFNNANEMLIADKTTFLKIIDGLTKTIDQVKDKMGQEYKVGDLLEYFYQIENQPRMLEVPTGFKQLDKDLYGGLRAGLYIIGAISSLGKTTFVLQMADQIAQSGYDVLFFSLEMGKYELMAKSISRNTYQISREKNKNMAVQTYAKDTVEILNNQKYKAYDPMQKNVITEAIKRYSKAGDNLYLYEGRYKGKRINAKVIEELVSKHIAKTGNNPIVIVDYLQIIAPENEKGTDKQNTDAAVFCLKEISRDFSIPVIAISSFNRDNYTSPVSMVSFKESGAVEYSSDVLIGLQYAGMEYDEGEKPNSADRDTRIRTLRKNNEAIARAGGEIYIELKCLKNRNGYKFTNYFKFSPKYNCYTEDTDIKNKPINKVPIKTI